MRSFDPRAVGGWECRAWETYYRRRWGAFLAASVLLVRAAFRMSWPRTLVGAWLVLRANQVWAPFPGNDPDEARRVLERMLGGGAALDLAPRRKPTSLSWVVVALICAAVGVVVGLLLA